MHKNFIIYPKTKISADTDNVEIVDATLKIKLKAFISGYKDDYGELPSIFYIQSIFNIIKKDADIALVLFKSL